MLHCFGFFFFFQAEDGIRDYKVTGVQTCALPISSERSLHHEREAERGPQAAAVRRRQDEAKGRGGRGNRCQPRDVAPPRRHRSFSSLSLESVRIREYRVPPNPTNAPTMVNTPSVPAFLSSHCPTSTKTTSVAASWRPSPAERSGRGSGTAQSYALVK